MAIRGLEAMTHPFQARTQNPGLLTEPGVVVVDGPISPKDMTAEPFHARIPHLVLAAITMGRHVAQDAFEAEAGFDAKTQKPEQIGEGVGERAPPLAEPTIEDDEQQAGLWLTIDDLSVAQTQALTNIQAAGAVRQVMRSND